MTVPCIGILRPPKMPESSKMTWNNYRSGKETGSSAISITSMAIPSKWINIEQEQ
jgi:hypothetical protein